ncbi:hypothetical protein HPB50_002569 [Hyalomma asiaticum]|uniref:Uncharacterized protein n=1 Tax=Hyalomma asiaticum TaxID=266040 RepID=A0ACB7TAX2_HYAAI|nr:hypothetical protein HPB50_002569 [Hyalomma asiaticum]
MILPITALRLAVAAAVENVTTPLPGDFPDGDVIIWRRSDEGSVNSSWLPPPPPPSFIPDKLDPGFAPGYNTRIRLPQNSTDVLTVADIAEIESMLVRLNDTTNGTSSADSETPGERVRRSVDDEDDDDDDDDNDIVQPKSQPVPEVFSQGASVPGYTEDAQMRPAPQMDDEASEFFGKFLGLKEKGPAEETHAALVEPAEPVSLEKVEDNDEQVRDRRQATPTPPVTSINEDVVPTTAPFPEPTTIAPSDQPSSVAPEATTIVPIEVTTLAVPEATTIETSIPTTFAVPEASRDVPQPSGLPTEKAEEQPKGETPGLPTTSPGGQPATEYPAYPIPPGHNPQNPQGFYPNPSGIIDPGFAPDPNRQLLQKAREEQRRKGLRQPWSHVPHGPWQAYPGGSGIIDPGFAPQPIDPILQMALEEQRRQMGKAAPGEQQVNQMTPEPHLNIVYADGSAQGYPPNAPVGGQGAEAPRLEDALIQQTQDQAAQQQQQEQLKPSAPQAENVNSADAITTAATAVAESNRE